MRMVLRELEPDDLVNNVDKVADVVVEYVDTIKMLRSELDSGNVPEPFDDETIAEVKAMDFEKLGVAMAVSEDGLVILEVR